MATAAAELPDDISEALAARKTRLGPIASRVVYLDTTSSTNDVADRLAASGAPHGTVVSAGGQESGRGRMGRTWFSPPGAGLYVSVVLRPDADVVAGLDEIAGARSPQAGGGRRKAGGSPPSTLRPPPFLGHGVVFASSVSLTAGVALAEGIRASCGLEVAIKWPNDLVVERRKVCGILAEASSRSGELQHVILGYGINLRPAAYPPDIAHRATSLESELGRAVDRGLVLAETLASLSEWLERAKSAPVDAAGRSGAGREAGLAQVLDRWRQLSPSSIGAHVEVLRPGGTWAPATTAGVDDDGALLVTNGGRTERVIAGEVRWI